MFLRPGAALPRPRQRRSARTASQHGGGFVVSSVANWSSPLRRHTLRIDGRRTRRRQEQFFHHGDQRRHTTDKAILWPAERHSHGVVKHRRNNGDSSLQHGGTGQALRSAYIRQAAERQSGGLPTESRVQPLPSGTSATQGLHVNVALCAVRLRQVSDPLVTYIDHVVGA